MRSPRRRGLLFSALCVCVALLATPNASAQTNNATLQCTVQDTAGALVAGATVTVHAADTGLGRSVTTSPFGGYVINFLPAGSYSVAVALSGFKTIRRTDVTLEVAQTRTEDFKLEVGALEEAITVTETAPPLDRNSPSISTVIGETQLKELPLNGRH